VTVATSKGLSRADGIRGWCGSADDALLCVGAARRDLYTSLRSCLFRSVGLWMACRNVAVRRRRVFVGLRSAAEMARSPRERLGGCRSSRRRRPRGTVRETDVIDAATARRWTAIRHIEKAVESVIDPNVLDKRSPIGNLLGKACVDDRETNDVCCRRSPVCEREHDRFVGRHEGSVSDDAALIDIYRGRRTRRLCRGRLQQQSATSCQHEPGDASPITPTSSHGVRV